MRTRRSAAGICLGLIAALVPLSSLQTGAGAQTAAASSTTAAATTTTTPERDTSYDRITAAPDEPFLHVLLASPSGRLRSVADASEWRFMFDRPAVELSAISARADVGTAITVTPAVAGTWRWASTRMLIFTPARTLPLSTRYTVVLRGLTAVDGKPMKAPYTLRFETPSVRCEVAGAEPSWRTGAADAQFRVTCDQPVTGADLAAHTTVRLRSLSLDPARFRPATADLAKMQAADPAGTAALLARLAGYSRTRRDLGTLATRFVRSATCPEDADAARPRTCHWLAVQGTAAPDATATIVFGEGIASTLGPVTSEARQGRLDTPRTPLVVAARCTDACDPEAIDTFDLTADVERSQFEGRFTVRDLSTNTTTVYRTPAPKPGATGDDAVPDAYRDPLSLGWVDLRPGRTYEFELDPTITTRTGRALGYRSITTVGIGNYSAYAWIRGGERVMEAMGRPSVRLHARNVTRIEKVVERVEGTELIRTVRRAAALPGAGELRVDRLPKTAVTLLSRRNTDRNVALPLPLEKGAPKPGVYVVGMRATGFEPDSRRGDGEAGEWQSAVVQVTGMAVTVKQSPLNVLVSATDLATGKPVAGADVSLYSQVGKPYWKGKTDDDGFAWGEPHPERGCENCAITAVVEHDDDLAYAQSLWRDGWDETYWDERFASGDTLTDERVGPGERLVGSVFTDRGVYKLGERVRFKAMLRVEGSRALAFPSKVDEVEVRVTDSRDAEVFRQDLKVSRTGAVNGAFTVPAGGMQGTYFVQLENAGTSFLVGSFRRPDFKVDVATGRDEYTTGDTLSATVDGRYLFGAAMDGRDVSWTARSYVSSYDPSEGRPALGLDGYSWTYSCWRTYEECSKDDDVELGKGASTLDGNGRLAVSVPVPVRGTRHPVRRVQVEATVTDVNRQVIANRDQALVHPGEVYLGVRTPDSFGQAGRPIEAKVAALTPGGQWAPGVAVTAHLVRWEWVRATRQDGSDGSSTVGGWRSTVVATTRTTSASAPVAFSLSPDAPGDYEVVVTGRDQRGNHVEASTDVYVLGRGYVPWQTQQDGGLTLVPEQRAYAPGDTARILVQSPWPQAEGIVTVERGEVFTARRFSVTSSAATVEVPVTAEHEPNVFVSVTVFKGRTAAPRAADPTDPGRPQVVFGTTELSVPPSEKQLTVQVSTDAGAYRPGSAATATVKLRGADGKPAAGEVTLWAVDEGVLRLTDYRQPNLLQELYRPRGNDVQTTDSRLRLVPLSAEADEKGEEGPAYVEPGGGGGDEDAGDSIRSDFRIVAAWRATVATGKDGTVTVPMKLPESLTEYRVMAVGTSGADRFGGGTSSLRIEKPFMVVPSLPRFLNLGDTTEAGVVLQNQTGTPGTATISVKMPANAPVSVVGSATRTVTLPPGPTEVRFPLKADKVGSFTVTFDGALTADGGRQTDAVRAGFPVTVTRRLESVAAAGTVTARATGSGEAPAVATEQLRLPAGVYPDLGGLEVEASTSALAGLQNGVKSLVEYPYGCLEQRSSRVRVLLMLHDLAATFPLPGLGSTARIEAAIRTELRTLPEFQTPEGGLSYWPNDGRPDLFLSARVLVLLLDAERLGLRAPGDIQERLVQFLQGQIEQSKERGYWDDDDPDQGRPLVDEDGLWFNRAHVLYALARAGKGEPSLNDVLWRQRFSLTVLEQVHLLQAMLESGQTGSRPERLLRELMNGVRIEADQAFLQGTGAGGTGWCPCLSYLFAGRVHSTAALLSLLLRIDPDDQLAPMMARWLLAQRDARGAWQNTLESGYALTALVDFYRAQEPQAPDLQATIAVGSSSLLAPTRFSGRSLDTTAVTRSMAGLVGVIGAQGTTVPLRITAGGSGRLYYSARLRYAPDLATLAPLDQGFTVQRDYLPYRGTQPVSTFAAGDLVRVRLRVTTAQQRQNVVIDDPLPAGLEGLDAQLSSTSLEELRGADTDTDSSEADADADAVSAWYAGVDHTELRDDRVLLFATTLRPGTFEYTYVARATAPGTFVVPPAQAEEMYRPELFGRTGTVRVTVLAPGQQPAATTTTARR